MNEEAIPLNIHIKYNYLYTLTPWIMEPRGSMPYSQGLSNNSYPELNQPNSSH